MLEPAREALLRIGVTAFRTGRSAQDAQKVSIQQPKL